MNRLEREVLRHAQNIGLRVESVKPKGNGHKLVTLSIGKVKGKLQIPSSPKNLTDSIKNCCRLVDKIHQSIRRGK